MCLVLYIFDNIRGEKDLFSKNTNYEVDMSGCQVMLTYSDVFDEPVPFLTDEIKKVDVPKAISIICELIAVRNMTIQLNMSPFKNKFRVDVPYELVLKKKFCNIDFPQPGCNVGRANKKEHIISLQALLILLKRIIIEGEIPLNETEAVFSISDEDYKQIIRMNLIIASELEDKDAHETFSASNYLYGTYHLNNEHNVGAEIARTYYIFCYLARNKELFEDVQGEYKDYWLDYEQKYGYTINDYMYVLFRILEFYIGRTGFISNASSWFNPQKCYSNTKIAAVAEKVLFDLSNTLDGYKEWCLESIDERWNFQGFLSKPFLRLGCSQYITISDYTLKNAFFENIFWKVRECYPKSESRTMAFFGRLYERYIQDQIFELLKNRVDYMYIPEFTYGKSNNRSSDAYIKRGTKLIAIEAKGFSVLFDCLQNKSVDKNLEKLFVKPILQADEAFFATREIEAFRDVTDLYILSVTMDNINAVPEYVCSCTALIDSKKLNDNLKGYYNISIEELEMLLFLLEMGEDIFQILEEYFREESLMPFSNYMRKYRTYDIKMTSFMSKYYDEFVKKMKAAYGFDE